MMEKVYESEAQSLIEARLADIRGLSFAEVTALPEASSKAMMIGGCKCVLTVYRQELYSDDLLITIQVARQAFWGMVSFHIERGFIFSRDDRTREATLTELQNSGG